MTLLPFLLVSACSVVAAMAFLIWLTAGFGGFFWIAYGHRQFWYFLIVAGAILIALCGARHLHLRTPAMIISCAVGGYVGSVVSYIGFAFLPIMRSVSAGNYSFGLRPFVVPFHLIFVLSGLAARLLVFAILKAHSAQVTAR